jgi:hypothetical protein
MFHQVIKIKSLNYNLYQFLSLLKPLESSPDPDPTVVAQTSMVSENLLNASLQIDHGSGGTSSKSQQMNGSYANFTTYNHARSSTVVSPENGKLKRF